MDRRSFLASAGAGLASLPFLGSAGRADTVLAANTPDLRGVTLTVAQNGPFWEAAILKSGVLSGIPTYLGDTGRLTPKAGDVP